MTPNNEVLRIFSGIAEDIAVFKKATNKADAEYAQAVEIAKEKAREYKDERGELQRRKDKARSAHKAEIFAADTSLVMNMQKCHIPLMRDYLRKYLCSAPDASFMATLSYYRQFNLTMTKTELNNLLNMAGGNYIALKCLATVAKDCGGWKVDTPSAEQFEKDIALLEGRMTQRPVLWHDTEHHHAACETRDTSSATSRAEAIRALKAYGIENGEDTVWKATSIDLLGAKGTFDEVVGRIDEMMERWSTGFVPSVSSYANELKKAGIDGEAAAQIGEVMQQVDAAHIADSAKVKSGEAEKIAQQIGVHHSKANAEAKKVLEAYTDK